MFMKKIQMLLILVIMALAVHPSAATVLVLDSIGRMPEITVTASRYENQDEAWAGLLEGIIVEAQRSGAGKDETAAGEINGTMSATEIDPVSIRSENSFRLLLSLTLTLATISILYISMHFYLAAKEAKHERTKNRS